MLGNMQEFGLSKGHPRLRRKHGDLRNRLRDLLHQRLEQRERKVHVFKVSEVQVLMFKRGCNGRFRERHCFAVRRAGLLSFGIFHFLLKVRGHGSTLSKRQEVLWKDGVSTLSKRQEALWKDRVEERHSIWMELRLLLDQGMDFIPAFILENIK